MMAVVKADAYGHGAIEVSRSLMRIGCRNFGVATLREAKELRAAGIDCRIYLMGGFFAEQADEVVALDLVPFAIDTASISALETAARRLSRENFPIHLKLDTGASRLGLTMDELDGAIAELQRCHALTVEGLCTLLANAADLGSSVTDAQLGVFRRMLGTLEMAGIKPRMAHVANSAATILRKDCHFNLVRVGLALYGVPPVREVREVIELRPVMTFKSRVLQVKKIARGTGVSYGHTFVASRPTTIGVLPVGYADGYRRGLQFGGEVLIRGRRAPVVGAVCMDLTMVDLTDVPGASSGDSVTLWGTQDNETISVGDLARLNRTIAYEMLCGVSKRVPRIYR
jgi:alanine racemase